MGNTVGTVQALSPDAAAQVMAGLTPTQLQHTGTSEGTGKALSAQQQQAEAAAAADAKARGKSLSGTPLGPDKQIPIIPSITPSNTAKPAAKPCC